MTDRGFEYRGSRKLMARISSIVCSLRRPERLESDHGAGLVEFAVAISAYFALFFGVIELCLSLYCYNFVCDAARAATRYTSVRGSQSCVVSSTFPNCNLLPTAITSPTNNPVLSYIETFHYPGLNSTNLSATVTWWPVD